MTQQILDETVLGAPAVEQRGSRRRQRSAQARLGWLLLLVVCVAFAVRVAPGMGAPFSYLPSPPPLGGGLPIDTWNGAVFSTGGRALLEMGPVESRFGGVWGGGDRYAHHPPLIYSATALSQWVVGDDELAARGLVFVASLATIVLLFLLLRELGLSPPLAAASVGIGLSVPMFLAYGTMLDTLTLGLPFAVGYLLLWQRNLDGQRHRPALTCAAAVAVLVAWEGAILVGVTIVLTVVLRRGRQGLGTVAAAAGGLVVGVGVTVAWLAWVNGGLSQVADQGLLRAGRGNPLSVGDYLGQQLRWLRALFGVPALIVLVLGVLAVAASRRFRPAGIAALATSLLYAGAFRQGSWQHDYWNYWLVVTLVLGTGALASIVYRTRRRLLTLAACCLAVAVVVSGVIAETPIYLRTGGKDQAPELAATRRPVPGQRWIPVVQPNSGAPGTTAVWTIPQERFYLRVPLRFATPEGATAYAMRHPSFWIIVNYQVVRGRDAVPLLSSS